LTNAAPCRRIRVPSPMQFIATHFDACERPYRDLRPHFAFNQYGIRGDAIVAFVGPCDVRADDLVDLADRNEGRFISAALMLHFVVEHFGVPLNEAVWRQRVLAAVVADEVAALAPAAGLRRAGDDLFAGDRKLSVSIATVSPTSAMIHFGVNVDGTGAPVKVTDLRALGVKPEELARRVLDRYATEDAAAREAACKVRGIC